MCLIKNKQKAFSILETMITLVIVGIISASVMGLLKNSNVSDSVLQKAGLNVYYQLDFASKTILAKNSTDYTFNKLKTVAGADFQITASGADAKLMALYKKNLGQLRNKTLDTSYKTNVLKNSSNTTVQGVSVSSFPQGFTAKNGAYIAIKLNGNCTTSETYIYNPSALQTRSTTKSCGLIFFDVNQMQPPNLLGIDQYIVSIGKFGVK